MIIDIHTHTFPEKIAAKALSHLQGNCHTKLFADGTEADLSQRTIEAGIDISVIVPVATSPKQVEHINDSSARINARTQETHLLSLGCMHPDYPDPLRELTRIKEMGLAGIKIHPVYQGVDICDERFLEIFRICRDLGLLVIAHSGLDIGIPGVHCSPQMSRKALDAVPGLTLILAHMGGWKNWDEVPKYLAGTGAYVDTAFSTGEFYPIPGAPWTKEECQMLNDEEFLSLVNALGESQVLFGTDSPWSDAKESLSFINALPLSQEAKESILGGNAARLLGLPASL